MARTLTRRGFLRLIGAGAAAAATASTGVLRAAERRAGARVPNVVILFVDDMGYGDPRCYNPESKCPTPHIDRLAAEGVRFTDAHAPGSWCIPSRYGLMTGRYPFRADRHRIEPDRMTIASLLKAHGYATCCVGKWHLGLEGEKKPPAEGPMRGGPVDRGFDYFFGIHASLDIPPYYYIENDRPVACPTGNVEDSNSDGWTRIQGAFWRGGGIAPGFTHDEVLPTFTDKAIAWLQRHHEQTPVKPFLLYLALAAPHTPWLPAEAFKDRSQAGMYGDFVAQVDAAIGRVVATLDKLGARDNTLVVFSSDNGPVWYGQDVERFGHRSVGPLRGMKADAWEGGHRMPFIARWPGSIKAGTTSKALICFTDVMATLADLVGANLPDRAGEDSISFLPVLLGTKVAAPPRDTIVHPAGLFAIRSGKWKLIEGLGSGGFSKPRRRKPEPGEPRGQLYDLEADLGETTNLYAEKPDVVRRLTKRLAEQRKADRSTPKR